MKKSNIILLIIAIVAIAYLCIAVRPVNKDKDLVTEINPSSLKVETKDKNNDGKPDVWLYYNDKKEHVKSGADKNYDNKVDYVRYLSNNKPVKEEGDLNFDGVSDIWVYYENGKKAKAERDTNFDTKPDIFIYYSNDKIIKVEKDTDFDGKIDETTSASSPKL